jgi:hypothetical protein
MLSRKAVSESGSVKKQLQDVMAEKGPAVSEGIKPFLAAMDKITKGDKTAMGLDDANKGMLAALRVVEGGNRPITAQAMQLYQESKQVLTARGAEWQRFKSTELPKLNQELEKAGAPVIRIAAIEAEIEYLMTR